MSDNNAKKISGPRTWYCGLCDHPKEDHGLHGCEYITCDCFMTFIDDVTTDATSFTARVEKLWKVPRGSD